MNINTLLLILVLTTGTLFAQKMGERPALPDPFAERHCVSSFEKVSLGTTSNLEVALQQYLKANNPNFKNTETEARLDYHRATGVSEHYSFRQYYRGIEVFNSEVKFNLDKQGNILSVFDNSYDTRNWSPSLAADAIQMEALNLSDALRGRTGYNQAQVTEYVVLAEIDGQASALKAFDLYDEKSGAHRRYLTTRDLNIVMERDLNSYGGGNRTPGTARVFRPDPLTSAGVLYVAPYGDSSDTEVSALNGQRKLVNIELLDDGLGSYLLENNVVRIAEFSSPGIDTFKFANTTLDFTRGEDAFEAVNVFYHITRFNKYINDTLALTSLANFMVEVDPHALNGNDNSMFSAGGGTPRLFYGEGGVDDAEDADVVIHEYGHALSNQATPGGNSGSERQALDEGVGDYVAASYSRTWSDYRWDDIFTWDGHNEYWSGRTATSSKLYYKDSLSSSLHINGEMWASALMEIWELIGRETSDKIALQTLYSFASGIDFTDAAMAYLAADQLLYQGAHNPTAHAVFVGRKFLSYPVGVAEIADNPITIGNTEGFAYHNKAVIITSLDPIQQLTLFDLTGKAIYHQATNNEPVVYFNPPALGRGVYILQVNTKSGASSTHKLVKAQ